MSKSEAVITACRDVYNKINWLNNQKMKACFKGYKASEVHCLEYIGKNEDSNVTDLAASFYMTRGAISKLTKKLIAKGVLESYQKPHNKKEIYFRLTESGQAIYKTHEELHQGFRKRDEVVFEQVSEAQIDAMLSFMAQYSSHLDAELKKMEV